VLLHLAGLIKGKVQKARLAPLDSQSFDRGDRLDFPDSALQEEDGILVGLAGTFPGEAILDLSDLRLELARSGVEVFDRAPEKIEIAADFMIEDGDIAGGLIGDR